MDKIEKKYNNFISLGYFCEVAQDLEILGLRNQSSPFDWGISYFTNVIEAIDKEFDGFMNYDNLSQDEKIRNHYREDRYNFYFFHDFNQYSSLNKQFESVKTKYERRINRFLETIKQPTLFVKYISAEEVDESNKSIELNWIENNLDMILSVLKRYNSQNDIVFIGDETIESNVIKIFTVKKDEGDRVSRHPIINNKELYPLLSSIEFPGREENIKRYNKKELRKRSVSFRLKRKMTEILSSHLLKEYKHTKIY